MPLAVRSTTKPRARAIDELEPVGAEDPQRALALAKHNAGVTKSQDFKGFADEELKHVGAKDGDLNAELDAARMAKEKLKHKLETVDLPDAEWSKAATLLARLNARVLALEKEAQRTNNMAKFNARDVEPVGEKDNELVSVSVAGHKGNIPNKEFKIPPPPKKGRDTELPMPIKTSNLVPMPSGEHNEERYAPRPVGDAYKAHDPWYGERIKELEEEVERCKKAGEPYKDELRDIAEYKKEDAEREKHAKRARGGDRKRTTDSIQEQISGSEPKDHMSRAAQYEIQGDRARALDSYRAAASGYRKAAVEAPACDASALKVLEAKARDGVEACQSKFAAQYAHPGAGRVKVCDSAEQAVRTAVERTRAGETVRVDGKTVRPGRATDAGWVSNDPEASSALRKTDKAYEAAKSQASRLPLAEKVDALRKAKEERQRAYNAVHAKDDTGGPPPVDEPAYPGMPDPVRTDDEHLGFKKLEGKLAHEKGVSDPAAVAAVIGRKKYGAAGMAKKAAAGRAKDYAGSATVEEIAKYLKTTPEKLKKRQSIDPEEFRRWAGVIVRKMHEQGHATDKEVQPV